jgi:hypothetical protein
MGIVNAAKRIMMALVNQAVESGDLEILFSYQYTMESLGIRDEKLFHVCVLYLYDSGYLKFLNRIDNTDTRRVEIRAKGIDFIEG